MVISVGRITWRNRGERTRFRSWGLMVREWIYESVSVVRACTPCTRVVVAQEKGGVPPGSEGDRKRDREREKGSGAKWRQRSCIDVRARSPPAAHTPAVSCKRVACRLLSPGLCAATTTALPSPSTPPSPPHLHLSTNTNTPSSLSLSRSTLNATLRASSIIRANSLFSPSSISFFFFFFSLCGSIYSFN